MEPTMHPDWDNTFPDPVTKEAVVTFWCHGCANTLDYTYVLPRLVTDVERNVMALIKNAITTNSSKIELKCSNLIEQKGLTFALQELEKSFIIYDTQDFSFKLTLLGWLMVWHSPY